MDLKYCILRDFANQLVRKIDDLENKRIDNESALRYYVHDLAEEIIAFYKAEFK